MAKTNAFGRYAAEYDQWFEDHRFVYESELEAIRSLLPEDGVGLEIGVGTGRFAAPLGVKAGVEPSEAMRKIARSRNIAVVDGTAEALPFPDEHFDYLLFVTALCFLDSLDAAFREAFRVLKPGGSIVIGMIDRNSALGRSYERKKNESRFYKDAVFRSVPEVVNGLEHAGFSEPRFVQTLFQGLEKSVTGEPVEAGYGEGAFVVIKAAKKP